MLGANGQRTIDTLPIQFKQIRTITPATHHSSSKRDSSLYFYHRQFNILRTQDVCRTSVSGNM